jgi:hypothetical protein
MIKNTQAMKEGKGLNRWCWIEKYVKSINTTDADVVLTVMSPP